MPEDLVRLDALLVRRGLSPSREKAKEVIESGQTAVNGKIVVKPAFACAPDDGIVVTAPAERYVSRGGYKLERALDAFGICCDGLRCLDLGASTGGFTDCLLQHGAAHVTAVDVGTGQLAASLRADPRVLSLEQTDFRELTPSRLPAPVQLVTGDLSFISLKLLFPYLRGFSSGEAVLLVKPQFEAGRAAVGKRGVVRDPKVHERVITEVCEAAALSGCAPLGLAASPITGQNGNVEYLLRLGLGEQAAFDWKACVRSVVREGMSRT